MAEDSPLISLFKHLHGPPLDPVSKYTAPIQSPPAPIPTVDPFKTKVKGKDQSRVPSPTTPYDVASR